MTAKFNFLLAAILTVFGQNAAAQEILVRIGLVAPLSGALAVSGNGNEKGARLAVEELNSQAVKIGNSRARFELIAEDDAGDPRQGTLAAQKLVDSEVSGVVGHQTSGSTIPASRLYRDAGIPQISPSTTSPRFTSQGFKTAFRLMPDDAISARALGNYAVGKLGMTKFAVVDDRTSYGQGIADEFTKTVVAAGATVVARDYVTDKSTDFNAVLTSIGSKRPDAVFVGGMYSVAGPMLRQMKQLGLAMKMLGGDGICDEQTVKLATGAASDDQVLCVGPLDIFDAGRMRRFTADFKARFGLAPEPLAPYSYDAVRLLVDAMVRAGSARPNVYLPFLAATRGFQGVTGNISFDAKGDLLDPRIAIYTFRKSALARVATMASH
ncbi:branched-chain amino acid ABC transporter substrate-binding protein [Variovorax sp. RCC_210]|uniref:branched-chain amino acid ABC transporter substrate-binding protein n=1 Tax=Variovorax sp. RCC_210 TaxID=3239217 RepID=UPI003526748E